MTALVCLGGRDGREQCTLTGLRADAMVSASKGEAITRSLTLQLLKEGGAMRYRHATVLIVLVLSVATWGSATEPLPTPADQRIADDISGLKRGQQALQQQVSDLRVALEQPLMRLRHTIDQGADGHQKRLDAMNTALQERLQETQTWLRWILPLLGIMCLAIIGGAIVLWQRMRVSEGRLQAIQPSVDRLIELRPLLEEFLHLRPTLEQIGALRPTIEQMAEVKSSMGHLTGAQLGTQQLVGDLHHDVNEVLTHLRQLLQRLPASRDATRP
jgi:hypothetical protein